MSDQKRADLRSHVCAVFHFLKRGGWFDCETDNEVCRMDHVSSTIEIVMRPTVRLQHGAFRLAPELWTIRVGAFDGPEPDDGPRLVRIAMGESEQETVDKVKTALREACCGVSKSLPMTLDEYDAMHDRARRDSTYLHERHKISKEAGELGLDELIDLMKERAAEIGILAWAKKNSVAPSEWVSERDRLADGLTEIVKEGFARGWHEVRWADCINPPKFEWNSEDRDERLIFDA